MLNCSSNSSTSYLQKPEEYRLHGFVVHLYFYHLKNIILPIRKAHF